MLCIRITSIFLIWFSCILLLTQAQDYDATTNIQLGMQGLMQAGSDPSLLAQLMQDMQVCWMCLRLVLVGLVCIHILFAVVILFRILNLWLKHGR